MAVMTGRTSSPITRLGRAGRGAHVSRPPAIIWLPATLVAVAVLLPLVYLVLRTLGVGGEIWELLFRARTFAILGRTVGLVIAVTGISIAISLPLAWLTARTDLPLQRM
ncbi:MAG: iron ABC transporter permease, partial [Chloroflexi bacterium]|nr:iron ABC transporter permease [Chloroflexota bacterium]